MVDDAAAAPVRNVRRGRKAKLGAALSASFDQKPFQQPSFAYAPVDLVSEEVIEDIHQASLTLLSETGLRVLHDEARDIMKRAGADVDEGSQQVRFDPELILDAIKTIPSQFTMHARNPAHNITLGGTKTTFNLMGSAPNASCMDHGRRTGNHADYKNFLRLAQMHNILHSVGGYPCEPVDIPASVRHLDCISDFITLTDKVYCIYSLGRDRVNDAIEMTRIAHGLTTEQLRQTPAVYTIINTNSPLQLDIPMMDGIIVMSGMGATRGDHALHAVWSYGTGDHRWRSGVAKYRSARRPRV